MGLGQVSGGGLNQDVPCVQADLQGIAPGVNDVWLQGPAR